MGNKYGNVIQTPKEASNLLFRSWCKHFLNCFDFIRVNFDSFLANNKTQQFPRSISEGACIWIQAETIFPQTLKQLQQIFYMPSSVWDLEIISLTYTSISLCIRSWNRVVVALWYVAPAFFTQRVSLCNIMFPRV